MLGCVLLEVAAVSEVLKIPPIVLLSLDTSDSSSLLREGGREGGREEERAGGREGESESHDQRRH